MRGYRRGSEDLSDTGKRKAPRLEHTFETDNDKNIVLKYKEIWQSALKYKKNPK